MAEEQQTGNSQKTVWPELEGKTYTEAETAIQNDNPSLRIFKVLEGQPVTMDYRPDRVRIIVNAEDKVVSPPVTG